MIGLPGAVCKDPRQKRLRARVTGVEILRIKIDNNLN